MSPKISALNTRRTFVLSKFGILFILLVEDGLISLMFTPGMVLNKRFNDELPIFPSRVEKFLDKTSVDFHISNKC